MALVAFACGSRSTRRVWTFFSASAAARLTAVVVLPTPPFWLAMVKTVVGMKDDGACGAARASCLVTNAERPQALRRARVSSSDIPGDGNVHRRRTWTATRDLTGAQGDSDPFTCDRKQASMNGARTGATCCQSCHAIR